MLNTHSKERSHRIRKRIFNDQHFLDSIGYTRDELMSIFLPNTYEMYWNTTPQKFVLRMISESKAFWDKNGRIEKAKAPREKTDSGNW